MTIEPAQKQIPPVLLLLILWVKEVRQKCFHRRGQRRFPIAPIKLERSYLIGSGVPDDRTTTLIFSENHMSFWKQHISPCIPIAQKLEPLPILLAKLGKGDPTEPVEISPITETIEILESLTVWKMRGPVLKRRRRNSPSNKFHVKLRQRYNGTLLSYPLLKNLSPISHRELLRISSFLAWTNDSVELHANVNDTIPFVDKSSQLLDILPQQFITFEERRQRIRTLKNTAHSSAKNVPTLG